MAAILQKRDTALVYRVLLLINIGHPYKISIDTCQNKVAAEQYHMIISWAQVYISSRSNVFVKLAADQLLVFRLDRGL